VKSRTFRWRELAKFWFESVKTRNHSEDISLNERIILKFISEKYGERL
jgi:hypothetical protein